MHTSLAVVGAQWGDEGKGKIVHYLSQDADLVVRYQGGMNAGHTIVTESNQKFVLHLVPCGVLLGKEGFIGHGCVVDLEGLVQELEQLATHGLDTKKLALSMQAPLLLDFHKSADALQEALKQSHGGKVGTTQKGIGPAYADYKARTALKVQDLFLPGFETKFRRYIQNKNEELKFHLLRAAGVPLKSLYLSALYGSHRLPFSARHQLENALYQGLLHHYMHSEDQLTKAKTAAVKLQRMVRLVDSFDFLQDALASQKKILFEGAQGTFLDIDVGGYPMVTSSNPIAQGVYTGSGYPPRALHAVLGVAKAYTTRVGEGAFPTQMESGTEEKVQTRGQEFGATTGRKRRCGYLDLPQLKRAVQVNGLTHLALNKIDVLQDIPLRVCTSYQLDGKPLTTYPSDHETLARCVPVYEDVDGFEEDVQGARTFEDLPSSVQTYLLRVEKETNCLVGLVSVGPKETQTIRRYRFF